MDNQPKTFSVSVVIAVFNAADYLPRAIESVLGQTLPPNEIIVVDDGSTDGTRSALTPFMDRISYIYQPNSGPGAARNTGIKAATSQWIAFLDADDEWLPHRLETQLNILRRNPELVWVSGNYIRCSCKSKRRAPLRNADEIHAILKGKDHYDDFLDAFCLGVFGWTGTMLIRRAAILEAGLFPMDISLGEDIQLWLNIAFLHPQMGFASEPLGIYHMEVANSLARSKVNYKNFSKFLDRNFKSAKQYSRHKSFEPCAHKLLVDWVRASLFDARVNDVSKAVRDYRDLLSLPQQLFFFILSVSPRLTRVLCRSLSVLSRQLKLRKKIFHPTD